MISIKSIPGGIILGLLLWGCSKTPVFRSDYQNMPMIVDGNTSEWQGKMSADIESGITYGITNDERNLYVKMNTRDETLTRQLTMGGVVFYIDTLARGREQLTLRFPVAEDMRRQLTVAGSSGREMDMGHSKTPPDVILLNNYFLTGLATVMIKGFNNIKEEQAYLNLSDPGIKVIVQVGREEGLVYEACIPLDMIFNEPHIWLGDTTRQFSYGFRMAGVGLMGPPGDQSPGGFQAGRGRVPGGGMPPGGGALPSGGGNRFGNRAPGGMAPGTTKELEVLVKKACLTKNSVIINETEN